MSCGVRERRHARPLRRYRNQCFVAFGDAGGLFASITEVDKRFREETPDETAAYFEYVTGRPPPRVPGEPGQIAPIIDRVERLVGDFQGRATPKFESILASLAVTTQAWVDG